MPEDDKQAALRDTGRWVVIAVVLIVLDQLTKYLAVKHIPTDATVPLLPFLSLVLTYNTGAAFSLLAGASGWQRWFFIGLGVVVSAGIIYWLRSLPRGSAPWLPAALTLVMGGALGNVIDRVAHGHVVDFLHFHWQGHYFPAFNVADSAITVGAALLIIDALLEGRRARQKARAE